MITGHEKTQLHRSEIIYRMCLTWRHDFGAPTDPAGITGMSEQQKQALWNSMDQLFYHEIEPILIDHNIEVLP